MGCCLYKSRRIVAGGFLDILCGEKALFGIIIIIIIIAEMKRGLEQPESTDPFSILQMLSV